MWWRMSLFGGGGGGRFVVNFSGRKVMATANVDGCHVAGASLLALRMDFFCCQYVIIMEGGKVELGNEVSLQCTLHSTCTNKYSNYWY
jgi:hypothetical protein